MILAILQTMRPRQWVKNVLVFAGLIFSGSIIDVVLVVRAFIAFGAFCLFSSAVYIINDIIDVANDRIHPTKRLRPIASGRLKPSVAAAAAIVLAAAAFLISLSIGSNFVFVSSLYFVLLTLYSLVFKKVVILDILILSSGFVLRAIAGAVAIGVFISSWLLTCTIFLALFLSLCKRRNELVLLGTDSVGHRPILAEYSPALIDQLIAVVTGSALISYSLYTADDATVERLGTENLVYTIPFVIFGIFRYLYLVHQKSLGGSPDRVLLEDRPELINSILWLTAVIFIIYVK
jgi:4-hydroxybenzoate polyprenyltransferase